MQDNVVVVGLGTIGLAIAVALASRDCRVTGYDIDDNVIDRLRHDPSLNLPIALGSALKDAVDAGALAFDSALRPAGESRTYIVAVTTRLCGSAFDAQPLTSAVEAVQRVAAAGDLIVLKSTVPIGTTRAIGRTLRASNADVGLVYCPDRSVTGKSFEEQFSLPHIVGGLDPQSSARATRLFARLGTVIDVGSPEAAEAAKLFANAQRDVTFGLANEFAMICEKLGLDMYEIASAGAIDYPRGGFNRPGPVGGPCLSRDTFLLAASVPGGDAPKVSLAARTVNQRVIAQIADTVAAHLKTQEPAGLTVAILGIAFKGVPVTDDVRGSAGRELMRLLAERLPGLVFRAWDAAVGSDMLAKLGFVACDDILSAATGASVVVVANDHAEFRRLAIHDLGAVMLKPALIYDLCGTIPRPADLPPGLSVRTFGIGLPAT
jgi:UDP-N-acetyl-D-mannosaminuronic acid dehydrogenase